MISPATGPAIIQRLDPRLKLAAAVAWSFLLSLLTSLPAALLGLAGSLVLALGAGLNPKVTLGRLAGINFFVLFMWLLLPFSFSSPGEVVAHLGPLEVTRPGLDLTILLTVKANAVALGAMAFFGSTSVWQLAAAAEQMGAPEKMTTLFLLMIRYFQVIKQEYGCLRIALKLRGFQPGCNLHTFQTVANLIGILLVRSLDRAERVHAAMLCRGYQGHFRVEDEFCLKRHDLAMSGFMLIMMIGVFSLNVATV